MIVVNVCVNYKSVVDTVTVDNIAASMLATAIVLIDYYSLQL